MTDKKTPATDSVVHPATQSSSTPASAQSVSGKAARPAKKAYGALVTALVVLLLIAAGLSWTLWNQRLQFGTLGREVATRLDSLNAEVSQSRKDMREALALSQAQSSRISQLEVNIRETQSQYNALQQAWQSFNGGASDELLANDIERLLTIASQQLRLVGNVGNAIVALETAQSRLVRAERPRFADLQQSITNDLDRLRAVPGVDIAAQAARIERLMALVSKAPLLVPDSVVPGVQTVHTPAPQPAEPAAEPALELPDDAKWWQRWGAEMSTWPGKAGDVVMHELRDLVSVQRVDEPVALMLTFEQAAQLRLTVRQRLLAVQLAMLMRQPAIWKNELDHVAATLANYYDPQAPDTVTALALTRELLQVDIAVRVPDVTDSLNSIAALRAAGFKANEGQD